MEDQLSYRERTKEGENGKEYGPLGAIGIGRVGVSRGQRIMKLDYLGVMMLGEACRLVKDD